MIAITICATKSYTYAMRAQARQVAANVVAAGVEPGHIILVGDQSRELKAIVSCYEQVMPEGWKITHVASEKLVESGENYKAAAQLLIAAMRAEAFAAARKLRAKRVWSLDSDVLPPPNALRCMLTMLEFDGGYYSVSTCPYPNDLFIGGFASETCAIAEDFLPEERKIPPELKAEMAANQAERDALEAAKQQPTQQHRDRWQATDKKIREQPPDGHIWQVIGKYGWRRRGWLDHAYPGIGLGSVVPIEWTGFGCALLNEQALALAHFEGYDGNGTEDLFICSHRWRPAGLKLNVITHCPCDHVIWKKKKGGDEKEYVHHRSYHEQRGEARGHLRVQQTPWRPGT
jgi:hypothetical protein